MKIVDIEQTLLKLPFIALKSILDESQLTEKQKLHLEVVKTLCFWCGFDSPDVKRKAGIEMDVDQSFIKSKLVKTLESIESNRSFDLSKVSLDTTFSGLKFLSTYSVLKLKNTNVIVTTLYRYMYYNNALL